MSTKRARAPDAVDPVNVDGAARQLQIFHISDLHIPTNVERAPHIVNGLRVACRALARKMASVSAESDVLLAITGDVFDNFRASPRAAQLLVELLDILLLEDEREAVLIAGNHDLSRADPDCDLLGTIAHLGGERRWPRLHYLRGTSSAMVARGAACVHHVPDTDDAVWPRALNSTAMMMKRQIILFHGTEKRLRELDARSDVARADAVVLLGDFHAPIDLPPLPKLGARARYAGSLVPLKADEYEHEHGVLRATLAPGADDIFWRERLDNEMSFTQLHVDAGDAADWDALPARLFQSLTSAGATGARFWDVLVLYDRDLACTHRRAVDELLTALRPVCEARAPPVQMRLRLLRRCDRALVTLAKQPAETELEVDVSLPALLRDPSMELLLQSRALDPARVLAYVQRAQQSSGARPETPLPNAPPVELVSIEVNDFASIGHARVALNAPVIVIEGANGSGKTNLLDALLWALTSDTTRPAPVGRGSDARYIREGAKSARVRLALRAGEEEIMIDRRLTPRHEVDVVTYRGTSVVHRASGAKAATERLRALVGDVASFLESNFAAQMTQGALASRPGELALVLLKSTHATQSAAPLSDEIDRLVDAVKADVDRARTALQRARETESQLVDRRDDARRCLQEADQALTGARTQFARARAELCQHLGVNDDALGDIQQRAARARQQHQMETTYGAREPEEPDYDALAREWQALADAVAARDGDAFELAIAANDGAIVARTTRALRRARSQTPDERDLDKERELEALERGAFVAREVERLTSVRDFCARRVEHAEAAVVELEALRGDTEALRDDVTFFQNLAAVCTRNNFATAFLRQFLPRARATMNRMLASFTDLQVEYEFFESARGQSVVWSLQDNYRRTYYEQASGFQRNMMDLAYRYLLAVLRSNHTPLDFVVLDEPMTACDAHNAALVAGALREFSRSCGKLILITHIERIAAEFVHAQVVSVARATNGVSEVRCRAKARESVA